MSSTPQQARWTYTRVVAVALSGALCALFLGMAFVAWGYSLSDRLGPGPGFFPFWLGLVGAALTAGTIVQLWRGSTDLPEEDTAWPDRAGALRAGLLLMGTCAAALALEPLGFRLTAFAFTIALLLALGVRRPVVIAVFALASSFGLFHVFYYWLKVPLPMGSFGM